MTHSQTVTMPPQLTVRETTADQVPPIPDPAKARKYFDTKGGFDEGRLHAGAGAYQKLVLDVRRAQLFFHCDDWRVPRDEHADRFPPVEGRWHPFHWLEVPNLMYWTIDAHHAVKERPFLTLEEGNAFARRVAPLAETLLTNLQPVPGTDSYDWSAESASAGLDIAAACTRYVDPPKGRRAELVNMAEAVKAHPDLVRDTWAVHDDAQLDEQAEALNRCGLTQNPVIAEAIGIDPDTRGASLVGTRAWLYEHRRQAAAGRPIISAAAWLAAHPVLLTDATTDAELETLPDRAAELADAEGVYLLNCSPYEVRRIRAKLRDQLLDEIATYGAARAKAEAAVKTARAEVYARLFKVFAWESKEDGSPAVSDTDLGKRTQVTRQAIAKLREQLDAPVTAEPEEESVRA